MSAKENIGESHFLNKIVLLALVITIASACYGLAEINSDRNLYSDGYATHVIIVSLIFLSTVLAAKSFSSFYDHIYAWSNRWLSAFLMVFLLASLGSKAILFFRGHDPVVVFIMDKIPYRPRISIGPSTDRTTITYRALITRAGRYTFDVANADSMFCSITQGNPYRPHIRFGKSQRIIFIKRGKIACLAHLEPKKLSFASRYIDVATLFIDKMGLSVRSYAFDAEFSSDNDYENLKISRKPFPAGKLFQLDGKLYSVSDYIRASWVDSHLLIQRDLWLLVLGSLFGMAGAALIEATRLAGERLAGRKRLRALASGPEIVGSPIRRL